MQRPAYSRVFASGKIWGKQPGLHLGCDFQFLRRSAIGFDLLGERSALLFDTAGQLIEARKPKRISVHIFEAGEYSAPGRNLRWKLKADSAAAPLLEFGGDVFGDEVDLAIASDKLVYVGIGAGLGESDIGTAVRRTDLDPPATMLESLIHEQPEADLVQVETQTPLLIANEDHDEVQGEVGILAVQAGERAINPKRCRGITHARDYISTWAGAHGGETLLGAGVFAKKGWRILTLIGRYGESFHAAPGTRNRNAPPMRPAAAQDGSF